MAPRLLAFALGACALAWFGAPALADEPGVAPPPAHEPAPAAPSGPAEPPAQRPSEPQGAPPPDAPAPEQAASKPESAEPPPDAQAAELASVQRELAAVMDELVQARARVAVVGKSLFKTKVRVKVDNRAEPDQFAARVLLWLDGAAIFSGDGAALRDPERTLWEGFAAPGPHVLTLEVEQRARDDEAYRYTLRDSFRFQVRRERRTDVRIVLEDDSDMASEFPDDDEGSYEVETRFEVRAVALED